MLYNATTTENSVSDTQKEAARLKVVELVRAWQEEGRRDKERNTATPPPPPPPKPPVPNAKPGVPRLLDVVPRPSSAIKGEVRKVPNLVVANGLPYLRYSKPQSDYVSRVMRNKLELRHKRLDLLDELERQAAGTLTTAAQGGHKGQKVWKVPRDLTLDEIVEDMALAGVVSLEDNDGVRFNKNKKTKAGLGMEGVAVAEEVWDSLINRELGVSERPTSSRRTPWDYVVSRVNDAGEQRLVEEGVWKTEIKLQEKRTWAALFKEQDRVTEMSKKMSLILLKERELQAREKEVVDREKAKEKRRLQRARQAERRGEALANGISLPRKLAQNNGNDAGEKEQKPKKLRGLASQLEYETESSSSAYRKENSPKPEENSSKPRFAISRTATKDPKWADRAQQHKEKRAEAAEGRFTIRRTKTGL